jgi:hypothetical protein
MQDLIDGTDIDRDNTIDYLKNIKTWVEDNEHITPKMIKSIHKIIKEYKIEVDFDYYEI